MNFLATIFLLGTLFNFSSAAENFNDNGLYSDEKVTLTCLVGEDSVTVEHNLTILHRNDMQSCDFVIPKQPDVSQIRLDFEAFQVGDRIYRAPTDGPVPLNPVSMIENGNCLEDRLTISPTENLPDGLVLCGTATNQHLYLHYGSRDRIELRLTQSQTTNVAFVVKVTMILSYGDSELRAPEGCTQYFQERAGRVESFNYPHMQLNSHQYSVCILSNGERQVEWHACPVPPTSTTSFLVTGLTPPFQAITGTQGCVTDYILIPGSDNERYCGGNFVMAQSSAIPFSLWVNFDESETPKELTRSSRIDPLTGCSLGFTCIPPSPDTTRCDELVDGVFGTCIPPPGYGELRDNFNIGFCLEYTIGST